jgi:hypothetical protein
MNSLKVSFTQELKSQYDVDNQGWRQAVADRAKKELANKEGQLRARLESERDQELEMVRLGCRRRAIPFLGRLRL